MSETLNYCFPSKHSNNHLPAFRTSRRASSPFRRYFIMRYSSSRTNLRYRWPYASIPRVTASHRLDGRFPPFRNGPAVSVEGAQATQSGRSCRRATSGTRAPCTYLQKRSFEKGVDVLGNGTAKCCNSRLLSECGPLPAQELTDGP